MRAGLAVGLTSSPDDPRRWADALAAVALLPEAAEPRRPAIIDVVAFGDVPNSELSPLPVHLNGELQSIPKHLGINSPSGNASRRHTLL